MKKHDKGNFWNTAEGGVPSEFSGGAALAAPFSGLHRAKLKGDWIAVSGRHLDFRGKASWMS